MTETINTPEMTFLNNYNDKFDYIITNIGDLKPEWEQSFRDDGTISRSLKCVKYNYQNPETGEIETHTFNVTSRFILSLCSRFGISSTIFNVFNPSEVCERLQEIHPRAHVRVVIENGEKMLAATNPAKSYLDFNTLMTVLNRPNIGNRVIKSSYYNGIVTIIVNMEDESWEINGDIFSQAFTVEIPIDGFGKPACYLSLVRESSQSFLTPISKAFKSEIQIGGNKDEKSEIILYRVLNTFNNEEGFQAIRQRLESAQTSSASLHECERFAKMIKKGLTTSDNIENMYKSMIGDVSKKWGIATDDSISTKKARLLPMDCTVADLVNFSIELTSHMPHMFVDQTVARRIQVWLGSILQNEYDLEGNLLDPDAEVTTPRAMWFANGDS